MKKILCMLLIIASFSTTIFAYSEKKNIQPDVKPFWYLEAKDPPPPPKPAPRPKLPGRGPRPHDSLGESLAEVFIDIFFDIFVEIAFESNWYVIYDKYPYATSDFYIQYQSLSEEITTPVVEKFSRYDAGVNVQYEPISNTLSTTARFDGFFFKFFGPVVEVSNFVSLNQQQPYFGNVKLGMELAGFQTFVFSWKWNFDWAMYYGDSQISGFNYGFTINSYPAEPFVIEYRCDVTDFLEQLSPEEGDDFYNPNLIFESYLETGVMIDNSPIEAYACWTYLYNGLMRTNGNSFGFGIKYFM